MNLNALGKYRVRRLALQLQQFTVKELEGAADVTPEVVQAFIHRELDMAGPDLVKREQVEAAGKPGRPPIRYTLTLAGTEVLARKNLIWARELNEISAQKAERRIGTAAAIPVIETEGIGYHHQGAVGTVQTHIAESFVFKGEITGSGALLIDGEIEGALHLPGHHVTVGKMGLVKADVDAKKLTIFGQVIGNVTVQDVVEIRAQGSLRGDVACQRISMEDGANFEGSIDIRKQAEVLGSELVRDFQAAHRSQSELASVEVAPAQNYASSKYGRIP